MYIEYIYKNLYQIGVDQTLTLPSINLVWWCPRFPRAQYRYMESMGNAREDRWTSAEDAEAITWPRAYTLHTAIIQGHVTTTQSGIKDTAQRAKSLHFGGPNGCNSSKGDWSLIGYIYIYGCVCVCVFVRACVCVLRACVFCEITSLLCQIYTC